MYDFKPKVCLKSWIMNMQLDVWAAHHMMCRQNYFLTRYDDKSMTRCHICHLSHGQFSNRESEPKSYIHVQRHFSPKEEKQ